MNDDLLNNGKQAIWKRIFTIEGSLRNKEVSQDSIEETIHELIHLYSLVEDKPPQEIKDIINEIINHGENSIEILKDGKINYTLIRMARFSPGTSDLDIIRAIRKCRKEKKEYENPHGKVKCIDPRFTRMA